MLGLLSPSLLERDVYVGHAEKALQVARAAESSLKAAELHLERLVTENELSIQVLRDEIANVRTRSQAARHQVALLRSKLQAEGITPTTPPMDLALMFSEAFYPDYSDFDFEDESF